MTRAASRSGTAGPGDSRQKGDAMRRTAFISTAAIAAVVAIALAPGRFAQASGKIDQPDAYALVDPSAHGPGNPGFVFQQNMASVRRVGTGRYCLRSTLHFDFNSVETSSSVCLYSAMNDGKSINVTRPALHSKNSSSLRTARLTGA